MAGIWRRKQGGKGNGERRWVCEALTGTSLPLSTTSGYVSRLCRADGTSSGWVLLGDDGVRVNGDAVLLGTRLLRDRDEISLADGAVVWFSTESLPHIEPFPVSMPRTLCARSRIVLTEGMPCVRCTGCGLWFAQTDEYPAWTYAPTCIGCPAPTDLNADYRWRPDDEEAGDAD